MATEKEETVEVIAEMSDWYPARTLWGPLSQGPFGSSPGDDYHLGFCTQPFELIRWWRENSLSAAQAEMPSDFFVMSAKLAAKYRWMNVSNECRSLELEALVLIRQPPSASNYLATVPCRHSNDTICCGPGGDGTVVSWVVTGFWKLRCRSLRERRSGPHYILLTPLHFLHHHPRVLKVICSKILRSVCLRSAEFSQRLHFRSINSVFFDQYMLTLNSPNACSWA